MPDMNGIELCRALRAMEEYELVGVCRPDPSEPGGSDALAGLASLSLEEIARDSERDKFLTAAEAVEYGLVDKMLDKRP